MEFYLLWKKNECTIPKTMEPFLRSKNYSILPPEKELYNKKLWYYTKQLKFLNNYDYRIFCEKTMMLWKKLWNMYMYYSKQ